MFEMIASWWANFDLIGTICDVTKTASGVALAYVFYNVIFMPKISFCNALRCDEEFFYLGIKNSSKFARLIGQQFQKVQITAQVSLLLYEKTHPSRIYIDVPVDYDITGQYEPVLTHPNPGEKFRWFEVHLEETEQLKTLLRKDKRRAFEEGCTTLETILQRSGACLTVHVSGLDSFSGNEKMFCQTYIFDQIQGKIVKGDLEISTSYTIRTT